MSCRVIFPLLIGLLFLTVLVSLALGRYPVRPMEIIRFLACQLSGADGVEAQRLETLKTVLVHLRMPRIVGVMPVGAALSISGTVLQAIFITPLVSPKLVDILGGASFGAALGTVLSLSWVAVQATSSVFGIIGVLVAVGIARLYWGDKILLLVLGGIISSLTVTVCGMLGWVGLVIPHMSRMLVGPDNRIFLPATTIIGAIFLLIIDDLTRLLFQVEIPLGILTALVGVPVFALILRNARKGWGEWS